MKRIAFLLVAVASGGRLCRQHRPPHLDTPMERLPRSSESKFPPDTATGSWSLWPTRKATSTIFAPFWATTWRSRPIGKKASVPGRHDHCPNSLELCPLGGKQQSLWPCPIFRSRPAPDWYLQFMVKDSRKYAATGGWGFAQFKDGKPADEAMLKTCFPCHEPVKLATLSSPVTRPDTKNRNLELQMSAC